MGTVIHEAVFATTSCAEEHRAIRAFKATIPERFAPLLVEVRGVVNNEATFFFGPDGSKCGWLEAEVGGHWRHKFKMLCRRLHLRSFCVTYGECEPIRTYYEPELFEFNGDARDFGVALGDHLDKRPKDHGRAFQAAVLEAVRKELADLGVAPDGVSVEAAPGGLTVKVRVAVPVGFVEQKLVVPGPADLFAGVTPGHIAGALRRDLEAFQRDIAAPRRPFDRGP